MYNQVSTKYVFSPKDYRMHLKGLFFHSNDFVIFWIIIILIHIFKHVTYIQYI